MSFTTNFDPTDDPFVDPPTNPTTNPTLNPITNSTINPPLPTPKFAFTVIGSSGRRFCEILDPSQPHNLPRTVHYILDAVDALDCLHFERKDKPGQIITRSEMLRIMEEESILSGRGNGIRELVVQAIGEEGREVVRTKGGYQSGIERGRGVAYAQGDYRNPNIGGASGVERGKQIRDLKNWR